MVWFVCQSVDGVQGCEQVSYLGVVGCGDDGLGLLFYQYLWRVGKVGIQCVQFSFKCLYDLFGVGVLICQFFYLVDVGQNFGQCYWVENGGG